MGLLDVHFSSSFLTDYQDFKASLRPHVKGGSAKLSHLRQAAKQPALDMWPGRLLMELSVRKGRTGAEPSGGAWRSEFIIACVRACKRKHAGRPNQLLTNPCYFLLFLISLYGLVNSCIFEKILFIVL